MSGPSARETITRSLAFSMSRRKCSSLRCSASSARLRSVMSRTLATTPSAAEVGESVRPNASRWRHVPSLWRMRSATRCDVPGAPTIAAIAAPTAGRSSGWMMSGGVMPSISSAV